MLSPRGYGGLLQRLSWDWLLVEFGKSLGKSHSINLVRLVTTTVLQDFYEYRVLSCREWCFCSKLPDGFL